MRKQLKIYKTMRRPNLGYIDYMYIVESGNQEKKILKHCKHVESDKKGKLKYNFSSLLRYVEFHTIDG